MTAKSQTKGARSTLEAYEIRPGKWITRNPSLKPPGGSSRAIRGGNSRRSVTRPVDPWVWFFLVVYLVSICVAVAGTLPWLP
jgi:hypothetical protein